MSYYAHVNDVRPKNPKSGTLRQWKAEISYSDISSKTLVEMAFENASTQSGQGRAVFLELFKEHAYREAEVHSSHKSKNEEANQIAGLPISIKGSIDISGVTTSAGSPSRLNIPPAKTDAVVVQRLRNSGAIIIGSTNMTEYACSGIGINPFFGTPLNPFDRYLGRIPGGSSSGAAVSVTDGMCLGSIGSDTAGSVRIPAALCGLVGFKPTQAKVPMDGVYPLSKSLDVVGPIARTVDCCSILYRTISQEYYYPKPIRYFDEISLSVWCQFVDEGLDDHVASSFASTLRRLSASGIKLSNQTFEGAEFINTIDEIGGIIPKESFSNFNNGSAVRSGIFDPRVRDRIQSGEVISETDYSRMLEYMMRFRMMVENSFDQTDAIICPTTAIVAPEVEPLMKDASKFVATNKLIVRNTLVANILNRPAITLPCQEPGSLPVGLMLIGKTGEDVQLLKIASHTEACLRHNKKL